MSGSQEPPAGSQEVRGGNSESAVSRTAVTRVNPAELSPPRGFSHAVTARAGTRLVFLAGQTALNGEGRVAATSLPDQFRIALTNLLAALDACGGEPCDLARVTVYTTDVAAYRHHAAHLGRIWHELAGRDYPAMAVIGAVRLWDEDAAIELDGIAVLP
ncbi:RidA family protein [Streptomyces tubbatahanensis]|uniref:RidA family protein n=1 Tax=Streptomyces tubbatahanensis TaxID=2923272 RepID=A0ABY3XYD8_9ACTN|nr:RidA family protein [Streptomyces tubbatahanensis]UNS99506.1 RidA family protein [Streptomyces tubbatahanensis]